MVNVNWLWMKDLCVNLAFHNQFEVLWVTDTISSLYFNRENCNKEAAKVFRKYYRRPYFLPPMAEATEGNWFIVSSAQNKTLHVSLLFLCHLYVYYFGALISCRRQAFFKEFKSSHEGMT